MLLLSGLLVFSGVIDLLRYLVLVVNAIGACLDWMLDIWDSVSGTMTAFLIVFVMMLFSRFILFRFIQSDSSKDSLIDKLSGSNKGD